MTESPLPVSRWRIAAAAAIVAALLFFAVLLAGPYYRNFQFQRYLEESVFQPDTAARPEEVVRTEAANYAARLGLPVSLDHVRVSRSEAGTYVEARYFVRVDLGLYTVDLHFRPSAGAR